MDGKETLKRCLKMMTLLSRYNGKTSTELAGQFGVSIRTIQRDILKIQDVGFIVEKERDRYKINMDQTKSESGFDVSNLTQFTKEEAFILTEAINGIEGYDPIKENLIKKLSDLNNLETLFNNVASIAGSEDIKVLAHAISRGYRVIVDEYTWGTANRGLKSLIIEPIQFASNYSRVWAYYPKQKKNFLLRLSGINGVKPTYERYKYPQYHSVGFMDVFKGYGYSKTRIKLRLSKRAYAFILEEFASAVPQIKQLNDIEYELETDIYGFDGIGRFCLGLPGHIQIIEPVSLEEYIEEEKLLEYDDEINDFHGEVSHSQISSKVAG